MANPWRFIERDLVAPGAPRHAPDDHFAEFRQRVPVEHSAFHQRSRSPHSLRAVPRRIDHDPRAALHRRRVEFTAGKRVGAGGVHVLTGFEPAALEHRGGGVGDDVDDIGAAHGLGSAGCRVHCHPEPAAQRRAKPAGALRAAAVHPDLAYFAHLAHRLELADCLLAGADRGDHRGVGRARGSALQRRWQRPVRSMPR